MISIPMNHWYVFRISFVDTPTMYFTIRATKKKEAIAKLPKDCQAKGCCIECKSFEDEAGAKWQISQWMQSEERPM